MPRGGTAGKNIFTCRKSHGASFRSVNQLIDAADLATLWGSHLLNQTKQDATTQLVGKRLQQQLAIETPAAMRPFYDAVVSEVAIVGSDPFLREGSDVTMLFELQQPALFRPQMDQFLRNAENSRDDAERSGGKVLGVEYVRLATPDRQIRVFSAYPTPYLHVRINSLAALLAPAGNEAPRWREFVSNRRIPMGGRRRSARDAELFARVGLGELLAQGAGNQVGFHVYDSTPMLTRTAAASHVPFTAPPDIRNNALPPAKPANWAVCSSN